jgi:hypothetical protein
MVGSISAMVESGAYMAGCAGTGRRGCECSQQLGRGMNIKLEQNYLYAYEA